MQSENNQHSLPGTSINPIFTTIQGDYKYQHHHLTYLRSTAHRSWANCSSFLVNKYTGAQVFQLRSLRANLPSHAPYWNPGDLQQSLTSGNLSVPAGDPKSESWTKHQPRILRNIKTVHYLRFPGACEGRVWNHSSLLPPEQVRWPEPQLQRDRGLVGGVQSREGPPTRPPAPPHSRDTPAATRPTRGPPGARSPPGTQPLRVASCKRHPAAPPAPGRPRHLPPGRRSPAHIRDLPPPVTWRLTKVSADRIPRGPK